MASTAELVTADHVVTLVLRRLAADAVRLPSRDLQRCAAVCRCWLPAAAHAIAGPFVQCLDRYFGNVCELDLVYNFHKVYMILDEFFLSGEIQETSKARIMDRLRAMDAAGGEN